MEENPEIVPGFYREPKSQLSIVASEALERIFSEFGIPLRGQHGENQQELRAIVFVTRLTEMEGEDGDDVGAAFGGFSSPVESVDFLLGVVKNMANDLGISMSVEDISEPNGFSQN